MSAYIRNAQGELASNPINELNTIYEVASSDTTESTNEMISNQNMYSEEPISQYDTEYNNTYRSTIERLRTQTESMCMALESALVPMILDGSCVQVFDNYVYRDTLVPIRKTNNSEHREYVYKTNMVKFITDRHRRLCYNGTIHVFSKTGDTYTSIAKDFGTSAAAIKTATDPYSNTGLNESLVEGIDIDTTKPATVRNLYQYGYIHAFVGFLQGQLVPWENMKLAADMVDTYIIIDLGGKQASNFWYDLPEECDFIYVNLPFKVSYFSGGGIPDGYENRDPIFAFTDPYATIYSKTELEGDPELGYFKIYCEDPNIIFDEFEMDQQALTNIATSKLGLLFNKRLAEFDYRHKIKRFNLLCFERQPDGYRTLIKDDFEVESHQFNILKITLDKILNAKRVFKVFYNTRVVYDQDNMLRIKNRSYLANEFEKYMIDVNSNVQTFINEIYNLKAKDDEDQLGLRFERFIFNNMEEGSTPADEFIYYTKPDTKYILEELARQIFINDGETVKRVIKDLIERAYETNFNIRRDKDEWFIRKNLPEMFLYSISDDYILDDMGMLDEVFDFTYKDQLSYRENLTNAADYIIGYDADKIEASIIRSIVSRTMTGSEVIPFIKNDKLSMSRWNINANYNYVMIFRNGELYSKYNTITYDELSFNVDMVNGTDIVASDEFEFVFFLNANNNVMEIYYEALSQIPSKFEWDDMDTTTRPGATEFIQNQNAIPCNTTLYDPENLVVMIDRLSSNQYNNRVANHSYLNTAYPLYHKIKSYKRLKTETSAVATLQDDEMINGLHRVTKQGGGEYFIYPSVEPVTGTVDPGNIPTPGGTGIDALAFAGCGSINNIQFRGTMAEWNEISKDPDWNLYMNKSNLNTTGGVHCTDGNVPVV